MRERRKRKRCVGEVLVWVLALALVVLGADEVNGSRTCIVQYVTAILCGSGLLADQSSQWRQQLIPPARSEVASNVRPSMSLPAVTVNSVVRKERHAIDGLVSEYLDCRLNYTCAHCRV